MYRIVFVLRSGEIRISPDAHDQEWAGRVAHQLGQCADVASVRIIADDDVTAAVNALLSMRTAA